MLWFILIISIANLLIGLFVFKQNTKKKENLLFGLLSTSAALWCFNNFMTGLSFYPVFWLKGAYAWGGLVISTGLVWVLYLTESKHIKKKAFYIFSLASLFFLASYCDGLIVGEVDKVYLGRYDGQTGPLFIFYSAFFFIFTLIILLKLYLSYRHLKGLKKLQILFVLLGTIVFTSTSIIVSFILPLFGYFQLMTLDSPSSIFFIFSIGYAVTRYRFLGIRVLFSKMYFYIIVAFFAYIFFYLVYFIEVDFLGGVFSDRSLSIGFLLALIFSFLFLRVLDYAQISSDILFYKGYNPSKILKDLVLKMSKVIDLNQVLKILDEEFRKILFTNKVDVLIFYTGSKNKALPEDEKKYICTKGKFAFKKLRLCTDDLIYQRVLKEKKIIIRDEIERENEIELKKNLDHHEIKMVLPLISRDNLIGVIVLGKKISNEAYTKEDISFLEVISSQASTAIENALLYQEVEVFSKGLQKLVNEQTADIRLKTERLQKLLTMRSEFLDIASHQLRTPVSVIKGVLSMLKEGSVPEERKDEFIESALVKSFKLEEVIDEILRASEMDSDKFEINMEPINILSVLKKIYEDKKVLAEESGLKLKFNTPKNLPKVLSNEKYIKHAIRNLINNSIQYTKKGIITISIKKDSDYVEIHIKDTGIGIPKKDIPTLFKKFSRAQNAVDAYTDGSGLGLFIIKKVMDSHPGGKVYIKKTELNKGTTMVLKLPIAKEKS